MICQLAPDFARSIDCDTPNLKTVFQWCKNITISLLLLPVLRCPGTKQQVNHVVPLVFGGQVDGQHSGFVDRVVFGPRPQEHGDDVEETSLGWVAIQ